MELLKNIIYSDFMVGRGNIRPGSKDCNLVALYLLAVLVQCHDKSIGLFRLQFVVFKDQILHAEGREMQVISVTEHLDGIIIPCTLKFFLFTGSGDLYPQFVHFKPMGHFNINMNE